MNNGNIYGYSTNTINNRIGCTLNINGGFITNISNQSNYPTVYNCGTLKMTGGTVTHQGGGYTLANDGGTAIMTGGTSNNNYGVN